MSPVQIGELIEGKYEIVARIGGGGMGEVYRARHVHLDETRVIKVMRRDLAQSSEAILRFRREAQMATQIRHANVAMLYDYSRLDDGSFYMVWESIDGQDVENWLTRKGPFPLKIALDLGIQMLQGLEAVHQAQIVHRDISPDNLMITTDSRGRLGLKIIDLGLAGELRIGDAEDVIGGKFNYCSPEHLGLIPGSQPDHLSDLYSLTIVLFRMLTGELPFPVARSAADIAARRGLRPRQVAWPALQSVLERGMSFERGTRYPAARLLREELERVGPQLAETGSRHPLQDGVDEAAKALSSGKYREAAALVGELERLAPGFEGLAALRARLDEVTQARHQVQAMQLHEMVEQYLASGQKALARAALSSLLELNPLFPEWETLERRCAADAGGEEHSASKRLEQDAGEALERGDVAAARRMQVQLASLDAGAARQLELRIAQGAGRLDAERRREEVGVAIETALAAGDVDQARTLLERLAELGGARVVHDVLMRRLEQVEQRSELETTVQDLESELRSAIENGEADRGRTLVRRLQELVPDHSGFGEYLGAVSSLEEAQRSRRAIAEGAATISALLDSGRLEEAEIAMRVLRRMDPAHPLHSHFVRRAEQVRSSRGS